MAKSRHGRVVFPIGTVPGAPKAILDQLGSIGGFSWNLPPQSTLARLIDPVDLHAIYSATPSTVQNRTARQIIGGYLRRHDTTKRRRLFRWIVKDWGHIRAGDDDAFERWVWELGDFSRPRVAAFMKKEGTKRISSWSKILSFVDHEAYPVYDALTSTALNTIIDTNLVVDGRFYMPGTQNTKIPQAVKIVRRKLAKARGTTKLKLARYEEYQGLLSAMAELQGTDVLDIEMRIFANAVPLAQSYIAAHPSPDCA